MFHAMEYPPRIWGTFIKSVNGPLERMGDARKIFLTIILQNRTLSCQTMILLNLAKQRSWLILQDPLALSCI